MVSIAALVFAFQLFPIYSSPNEELLVRIEISDAQDLHRLKSMPISMRLRNDRYILAAVAPEHLAAVENSGFRYQILEEKAGEKSYYLVSRPHNLPLGEIPSLYKILYKGDHEALLVLREDEIQAVRKQGFNVIAISRESLPWRISEPVSLLNSRTEQVSDPIVGAIVSRVSDASITAILQRLQDFHTRYADSDSIYSASQWIAEEFRRFGYTDVAFDTFTHRDLRIPQRNVIAAKSGSTNPSKIVMIGGHYDSIVLDGTNPMIWAPGVDDDGTGVAAALEAARCLADVDLQYTVYFACWSAEEEGLLGSEAWVSEVSAKNPDIVLYLNFDMIGNVDKSDPLRNISIYSDQSSSGYAEMMRQNALLYTTLVPQIYGAGYGSDHVPFWQNGYHFSYAEEGDFSPNWHRATDTIDNVEIPYVTEVIKMGLATLVQTAGAPASLSGPFVTYNSCRLNDDKSGQSLGNANGYLDPGENIELFLNLKNVGQTNASEVTATLETIDSYVSISNGQTNYGDIAVNDSATSAEPFVISISTQTPNGHIIPLALRARDAQGKSWESSFTLKVVQPAMSFESKSFVEVSGDGDSVVEPGEMFDLIVRLKNDGLRSAEGITTTLSTQDKDIILVKDQALFAAMPVDSAGDNVNDPFTFTVLETAPLHAISFQLDIAEGEGFYKQQIDLFVLLGQEPLLLVLDNGKDEDPAAYIEAANQLGATAYTWQVKPQGVVPLDTLLHYKDVIWFTGSEGTETLSKQEQDNLVAFLSQGGHLLISGDFIGYRLRASAFYSDYLHAKFVNMMPKLHHLCSVAENRVTTIDTLAINSSTWPMEIDPISPARSILIFDQTTSEGSGALKSSGTAALAVNKDGYKIVYCAFGIENILSSDSRTAFLADVLQWFKAPDEPTTVASQADQSVPAEFALQQNYPNPFSLLSSRNESTIIKFQLPQAEELTLKIYNTLGQEVATLMNEKVKAGYHQAIWNGRLQNGQMAANGIYLYRIKGKNFQQTRKMLVMH